MPLVAFRLDPGHDRDHRGTVVSLPRGALVEVCESSSVGSDMMEVLWLDDRYAVFERDLQSRATPESGGTPSR